MPLNTSRALIASMALGASTLAVSLSAATPAHAIGASIDFVSVSLQVYKKTINTPLGPVTIVVDPEGFQTINLSLNYNPSLFSFVSSGFLCDFTSTGNCPPTDGLTGTNPISTFDVALGNALTGATATVNVNPVLGTIDLAYDLSSLASPPPVGSDRNAFGVELQPLIPLANLVTYETIPGNFDFNSVSSSCTAFVSGVLTSGACSSVTPITGIQFFVPEPTSWSIIAVGILGLGVGARRRRR